MTRRHKVRFFFLVLVMATSLSGCINFKPDIEEIVVEPVPERVELGPIDGVSPPTTNSPDTNTPPSYPSTPPKITDPGMNSPWRQVDAPIKNAPGQRSLEAYIAVIEQFDVANSYPERYKAGTSNLADTRCNIFAGDVMRAMGAPLPTKGELGVGHGAAKNTDPMTANARDLHTWLNQEKQDWKRIDPNNPADLQLMHEYLQAGKPVLAADSGHIAVVRPDNLPAQLTASNLGSLHIAQAGAYNTSNVALAQAGYSTIFSPTFFIHI